MNYRSHSFQPVFIHALHEHVAQRHPAGLDTHEGCRLGSHEMLLVLTGDHEQEASLFTALVSHSSGGNWLLHSSCT